MKNKTDKKTRCGFVGIIGRPNVGKSTLLNIILGQKLAIVSKRPQTTRNRILGVTTRKTSQIVLVDTPGIHKSRSNLNRFMVREAFAGLDSVDCILLVTEVDPYGFSRMKKTKASMDPLDFHSDDKFVLEQLKNKAEKAPTIVVLNKIDLIKNRALLLPLIALWNKAGFEKIIPISALYDDGINVLLEELETLLPYGPHLYPKEMFTDRAERFLASELIREQVFCQCQKEIPYATAVEIERFEERKKDVCIDAVIYVERDSQKAIVVGHRGNKIKQIGIAARQEISSLLSCPTHIKLVVRVKKNWSSDPALRREFGYE